MSNGEGTNPEATILCNACGFFGLAKNHAPHGMSLAERATNEWPHCIHCDAAVDDNPAHVRPIHYWSEEAECFDSDTVAEVDPAAVAALPDAWWQHHKEFPGVVA